MHACHLHIACLFKSEEDSVSCGITDCGLMKWCIFVKAIQTWGGWHSFSPPETALFGVEDSMRETQETRVPSRGGVDPLEKEMATHSRSLAWEIPRTEEPGGLQSVRSQKVGHD